MFPCCTLMKLFIRGKVATEIRDTIAIVIIVTKLCGRDKASMTSLYLPVKVRDFRSYLALTAILALNHFDYSAQSSDQGHAQRNYAG